MTYEQFYATYYNPENTEQTVYTEEVSSEIYSVD